jgi:hypothetical protein
VFARCADYSRTYQGTPVLEPPEGAILTEKTPRHIKREQSQPAFADDCVLLAGQTTDPMSKLRLLDMAAAYLQLADQAEQNGQTDRVYEIQLRAD